MAMGTAASSSRLTAPMSASACAINWRHTAVWTPRVGPRRGGVGQDGADLNGSPCRAFDCLQGVPTFYKAAAT